MRSVIALALISRALALPINTGSTSSNTPGFVSLAVARSICDDLARAGRQNDACANLKVVHAVDVCNTGSNGGNTPTTPSEDPRDFGSLLKLALAGLNGRPSRPTGGSGTGGVADVRGLLKLALGVADNGTPSSEGEDAAVLRPVLKVAIDALKRSNDSGSQSALPLLNLCLARLGDDKPSAGTSTGLVSNLLSGLNLKLANTPTTDARYPLIKAAVDILNCNKENAPDGSVLATVKAAVGASATQSVRAREAVDLLSATRLASVHLVATHAATSAEYATPTSYSSSSSKSGELDLDELMNDSSEYEKYYETEKEDSNDLPVF